MAERITDTYLSELERLSAGAAPGPWETDHSMGGVESFAVVHAGGTICTEAEEQPGDFDQDVRDMIRADFAFIAAARAAVPALVAEVRRLRADRAR